MGRNTRSEMLGRRITIYLGLVVVLWIGYTVFLRPPLPRVIDGSQMKVDKGNEEGDMEGEIMDETQEYGVNARPGFTDIIQLLDLPSSFLPKTGKHRKEGRLVIVGDVHGMKDSLLSLLSKVNFDEEKDHLILAGDMISKGPDSPGVVDLAMKLGASAVRGNHEDRVILAYTDMLATHIPLPGPAEDPKGQKDDELEEESWSHGDYKDRRLAKELGHKRMEWLKKRPVILRVGDIKGIGEVVVVHAGLAPGVKLEKQDPVMVMNMRTIGEGGVPSDERKGEGWMKAWNKYQKDLPKKARTTVIYGHDSKRGLQIEKYSMGIDTRCMKGGRLTAVVIKGGHSEAKHNIVHVNCKDGRTA